MKAALPSLALAVLLWPSIPARALDKVVYRDPKSGAEQEKAGTITKESPEEIELKAGATVYRIPVRDVVSVARDGAPSEFRQGEEAELAADYAAAADLYARAIAAPKAPPWVQHDGRFRRAESLFRLGRLPEAAEALKDMLAKAPEGRWQWQAQVRLAQCHLFGKRAADAEAVLTPLASSSSRNSWMAIAAQYWLGRAAEAKGNAEGASKAYRDAELSAANVLPDLRDMAVARARLLDVRAGPAKLQEALAALAPLADEASGEKAGGAALLNAYGEACLASAKAAGGKSDEAKRLAFDGLMAHMKVVVGGEAFPDEHAAALAGAEACFTALGDVRAKQMLDERKRCYNDAFVP